MSLPPSEAHALMPALTHTIRAYRQADALASRYQGYFHRGLALGLACTLLAGLCFVLATDIPDAEPMLYGYFAAVGAAIGSFVLIRRLQWQRRYLDYRVLAETLRVQFYWALAGVPLANPGRLGNPGVLGNQGLELGWIRHVLRYTALQLSHRPTPAEATEGLTLAIRHWIGRSDGGQLGYYRVRTRDKHRRHLLTERITLSCFIAGMVIALLLAAVNGNPAGVSRDWMIALMGLLPLAAAVRQDYDRRLAQQELVAQYAQMERIFASARSLLDRTEDPERQRRLLRDAGIAALHENALWNIRQRERTLPVTSVISG